jgi:hypothetical protein
MRDRLLAASTLVLVHALAYVLASCGGQAERSDTTGDAAPRQDGVADAGVDAPELDRALLGPPCTSNDCPDGSECVDFGSVAADVGTRCIAPPSSACGDVVTACPSGTTCAVDLSLPARVRCQ